MSMTIRDERPGEEPAIRELVEAAFGGSAEEDLVDRLRADGDAIVSRVAVEGGSILGIVVFSRLTAPFRALALAPLAVRPERQGTGIGSRLVRDGLTRAAELGWDGVFVLGEPRFYGRFGFDAALAEGFRSPYGGPHLMAVALAGILPAAEGRLDYPPAFAALG
jgi:putative acetyltransferase